MLEQFKNISRKRGRALLAALVAFIATITGCDKKAEWRGVSTDSSDTGRSTNPDAARVDSADGNAR